MSKASPPQLSPVVINSPSGNFYLKVIPDDDSSYEAPFEGYGIAYQVQSKNDKKIWSFKGWYDFPSQLFLANDGIHLIRLGWGGYQRLSEHDPAILFYRKGKLFRQYSTKELVKDPSKVDFTPKRPYKFIKGKPSIQGNLFKLTTIDGQTYTFNIEQGKIIETN